MDVAGIPLRLVRGGQGSRVLFLHGAAGLQGWVPFFEALSASHEVVATEHPGFGLSHAQTWADTMAKLADFYVSVLKNSELGKVHLIGSSLGGWLASEIAIRDQSLLRSLVLLAPAGMNSPEIPVPDFSSWSYPELMRQVFADPKIAEQVLSQPLSAAQQELRANNGIAVARLGRAGLHNPALAQSLSTVKIATTIIWGDTDRVTPTEYAPLWKHAMPHARLHIIPQCGHLPQVERLPNVLEAIGPQLAD
ncbi:alpha/beta fold hydrolase [Bradyrhizobium sp. AS23.2]|uniref:alpha/beta fold hydrolase n=1 Tax=Bradyrhizobium sp. AS23.2 TaxID=1680155 RepID=UPI00142F634F|nr:alpha/beta fold hydrolase [Bradyrhizobium sp. AS23.2]